MGIKESDPIFVKFLDSNNLQRTGMDFAVRSGIYKFPLQEGEGFRKQELSTAYGAFVDGHCGHNNKVEEKMFGRVQEASDYEPCEDPEVLITTERRIGEFFSGGKHDLEGLDAEKKRLGNILVGVRGDLYLFEYNKGRSANTLNE